MWWLQLIFCCCHCSSFLAHSHVLIFLNYLLVLLQAIPIEMTFFIIVITSDLAFSFQIEVTPISKHFYLDLPLYSIRVWHWHETFFLRIFYVNVILHYFIWQKSTSYFFNLNSQFPHTRVITGCMYDGGNEDKRSNVLSSSLIFTSRLNKCLQSCSTRWDDSLETNFFPSLENNKCIFPKIIC